MAAIPDNSIDSIVTDPPYGLSFMGKKWDYDVPSEAIWRECLRVLKPGGHLLAFAGTRTQHRMAVRIEDAGFEIRDMIAWVYGSGFPKSLDVSKAIDKAAGAEREVIGVAGKSGSARNSMAGDFAGGEYMSTAPATDAARQWARWGTALKPALEPITVARKPLIGTVAENVLAHGTGALNVDGCRVGDNAGWSYPSGRGGSGWHGRESLSANLSEPMAATQGRWPANLIHDGSEEVVGLLNDAARFFYCAKASKRDRNEGNNHPTVKPTDLMRYLCRLVTPPGGTVFDPFMGSGSTGKAAAIEGFSFIGAEMQREYFDIAASRIGKKESIQQGLL
jgi:site-specific DNA-methyltransferase (adenine-specific)